MLNDSIPLIIKYLDFIADPSDPNFDPIKKVTCFSAPITDSTILKFTLQEAYTSFLDPVQKNMIYQKKQPKGVRYLWLCKGFRVTSFPCLSNDINLGFWAKVDHLSFPLNTSFLNLWSWTSDCSYWIWNSVEKYNAYYFSIANQQKAGTKIYSLTQCNLRVNECDWHIF